MLSKVGHKSTRLMADTEVDITDPKQIMIMHILMQFRIFLGTQIKVWTKLIRPSTVPLNHNT